MRIKLVLKYAPSMHPTVLYFGYAEYNSDMQNKTISPYQIQRDPSESDDDGVGDIDDRQFATTLARGLELLRCFTPLQPLLSNRDLAVKLSVSRPTISRFTYTLVKLGYLVQDRMSGKYKLGPAVLTLGYPYLASLSFRQRVRPLMDELAKELRASVSMAVRDRLSMVYIETSRGAGHAFIQLSDIGLRFPMVTTAVGRAYLAGCDTKTRESIINAIRVRSPDKWRQYSSRLEQVKQEFVQAGFCSSLGEQHPEFHAVAVPFKPAVEEDPMVFNCVVPSLQANRDLILDVYGPKLVSMVHKIRQTVF